MRIENLLNRTTTWPGALRSPRNIYSRPWLLKELRRLCEGEQKVILRRARTTITTKNVDTLRFLELMNLLSPDQLHGEKRARLQTYMRDTGIARRDITRYAPFFLDNAMRTLIESEVIYNAAP